MPALYYETYSAAADRSIAPALVVGFCFMQEGSDDVEFDIVLGTVFAPDRTDEASKLFTKYQWVADAIVKASKEN